MFRCYRVKKCVVLLDFFYDSILVYMLVNCIMKDGKKILVYKIVY